MAEDRFIIKKTCFNNTEENTLVELYSLYKISIKEVDNRMFEEVEILMSALREEAPASLSRIEEQEAEVKQEVALALSSNVNESFFINEIDSLIH